ncbi:MAG: hydantoinase/oxoprolinase family protein [Coriobacteriales bacterium]|nr:hydantoinase/oxoprolinase family protein [Coriobacteriales bacterium]
MRIGIGIDTGGTYTDAVAFDFDTQRIRETAKALTTKEDLSKGILEALDGLSETLLKEAEILSLSTTLATNACVENKGGDGRLIIFGGDARSIDRLGGAYGLPPAKDIYLQESYTNFSGESEREVDWGLFEQEIANGYEQYDCIGIVEINATRTGGAVEKQAKALLQQALDIPVICGHELFSKLNYLQRGSSALLNARLYPVIKEFLEAIKTAVARRALKAKLIIMRSDGSVMSEEFASLHPIETLLCGPAASALGGLHLCNETNSIVIDMGGTTTDISLIKEGAPVVLEGGVNIGRWKTFVDGLYSKTVGLGGDSALHYERKRLRLEEYRVVPLCVVADTFPGVINNLKRLNKSERRHSRFIHEHLLLTKNISDNPRYTDEEKRLGELLGKGPMMLLDAARAQGRDLRVFDVSRLVKDGVVEICGLTPTDIMHLRNDFVRYATEASRLGAEFVARNLEVSVEHLCEAVYREVKRKLYVNIVQVLLENQDQHYRIHGINSELERLINYSFELGMQSEGESMISPLFTTQYSLVGTGAPIRFFLSDVARMLHTTALIPENYEVANAVGAITGNISAVCSVEVVPTESAQLVVYGISENRTFLYKETAEAFAAQQAALGARQEALRRGARGELAVFLSVEQHKGESQWSTIYLGSTVSARAVGGLF